MVPPEVERLERGQVPDLDGQVGDLVAGGVQLHEGLHPPDLLGQGDEPVVVHDEALEAGQLTNRGGQVAQLISAGKKSKTRRVNIIILCEG